MNAKVFTYRARIADGDASKVLSELSSSDQPAALEAVALLAKASLASPKTADNVSMEIEQLLSDETMAGNATVQTVAATAYLALSDERAALKTVRHQRDVEQIAISVQALLRMNRIDLAARNLEIMRKMDDDHSLTQICGAWIDLFRGGAKTQEASYVLEGLSQKFGGTAATVANGGLVVGYLHLGRMERAREAMKADDGEDDDEAFSSVNRFVCAAMSKRKKTSAKDQVDAALAATLSLSDADASDNAAVKSWLKDRSERSDAFDAAAAKWSS